MTVFSEIKTRLSGAKTALLPCFRAVLALEIANFQAALEFFNGLLIPA